MKLFNIFIIAIVFVTMTAATTNPDQKMYNNLKSFMEKASKNMKEGGFEYGITYGDLYHLIDTSSYFAQLKAEYDP